MKKSILFFGSTFLLFIGSLFTHNLFFKVSLNLLKTNNKHFIDSALEYGVNNFLNSSVYYIIGISIIPLCIFYSTHYLNIKSKIKISIIGLIILLSAIFTWYYKIISLNHTVDQLTVISSGLPKTYFNIMWLTFGKHLFFGIIVSTLILCIIGKIKRMLTQK